MLREYIGFTVLASYKAAARSRSTRYDVVQIHNPPDFLIVAALIPRARGARVIFDVHDLSSDMFLMRFEGIMSRMLEWPLRMIERLAARIADAVITVHEPYKQELVARGVAPTKISVVMNTVDESLLPTTRAAPAQHFRVVYHGSVTPHYGVELVVTAVADVRRCVPDVELDVYGSGDALPGAQALVRDLGAEAYVHMTGQVMKQRDVLSAVQTANVGVIPNLPIRLNRYALSSKLFEYVVLGIPAVCADLETLRQHFADDEVLFFKAGDAGALADALRNVAEHPSQAAARAERARRRYETEYAWAVQGTRYCELLATLSNHST
jgi:glycosyltransferase involved in cell wall biosynthesis